MTETVTYRAADPDGAPCTALCGSESHRLRSAGSGCMANIDVLNQQRKPADTGGTDEGIMRPMGHDGSVGRWQVIQAMELTRALRFSWSR